MSSKVNAERKAIALKSKRESLEGGVKRALLPANKQVRFYYFFFFFLLHLKELDFHFMDIVTNN